MALFGFKTQFARLGAALFVTAAVTAAAVHADGTLKLEANSTLLNPCNGEVVTGLVTAELVVQAMQNTNGASVTVHRTFHGTMTGDDGNTYKVSSIAKQKFGALAPYYDLTFDNNVVGVGDAPDFTVTGNLRVFVNAEQEPLSYSASGLSATCK